MTTSVPLPSIARYGPPDAAEVAHLARGLLSAPAPASGLTELQRLLAVAQLSAMTGIDVDPTTVKPIDATAFATGLAGC